MTKLINAALILCLMLFLPSCNKISMDGLAKAPTNLFPKQLFKKNSGTQADKNDSKIEDLISGASASIDTSSGFQAAVKSAVLSHPSVILSKQEYFKQLEAVSITRSQKDFQVSSTIYGGVEDVTDETAGVALVLNASRLVYDAGQLDSQVSAGEFLVKAADNSYKAVVEERSLEAARVWVQLERYQALDELISSRLRVLEPLIKQLEQVAESGIGDVSMIAAAERTVSQILVAQMEVSENLELAKVNFENVFGEITKVPNYSAELISNSIPPTIDDGVLLLAPGLLAEYYSYKASIASLNAIRAKDDFTVGFESKVQRPFGGSEYDSDETIGLIARKTIFNGNRLDAEIKQGEAQVSARANSVKVSYRNGKRAIDAGLQTISSSEQALKLARENLENAREEISYLRRQLVIGQSTLENVLSAEARLYDAESKELNLQADLRIAELSTLSAIGYLAKVFNVE